MSNGSGLFTNQRPQKAHLMQGGGGIAGEVADLRDDVAKTLKPLAAITVDEFTNPGTSTSNNLKAATATVASPVTLAKSDLLSGGLSILAAAPRNLIFTTAGGTAADAPATATITGKGPNGEAQTETVNLAQTAAAATGVKLWTDITSIAYPAADGTGATIAIGVGKAMYLSKMPKARAGLAKAFLEIVAGAVVTNGVFDATNQSYTPNTAQEGSNDYAVYYEYDPTA